MGRKRPHHGNKRRGTHPKAHRAKTPLTGTLRVFRPGYAQVETPEGTFAIARRGLREGMNGDEVQVSLVPMHGRGGERVAYVQTVLQRAHMSFVGTYAAADPLGVVSPLDSRISHDFFVLPDDQSATRLGVEEGDVVVARILEYPSRQSAGVVTLDRRLGSSTELDVDVEAVVASYGLAGEFAPAALEEAAGMSADVSGALARDENREDLRSELCLTVDPRDARDFDDAVGARRRDGGGFEVSVHIADVTNYVRWGSALDVEAQTRTCSAYLVDRVIPMLPEKLCNDVCSLRPEEDRLAMTVRIELDSRANVTDAKACASVIRSRARLSYDEVDDLLEGVIGNRDLPTKEPDAVAQTLRVLDEVAQLRLGIRHERGAIDFATTETKVVLDEEGRPVDVVVRRRTRATSLVEEAMLLANECVARMLAQNDVATAYRVHEAPSPDDLAACVPALRELELVSGQDVDRLVAGEPRAIQTVLEAAEGTSGEYLANALLLRAQKRAIYLPHNDGHYALGAQAYCHFTSPIRRYPDVLVHRSLKRMLAGELETREQVQTERALPQICRSCSDRERVADAAARASQRVKLAQLYGGHIGERFSGVVVGCERHGLFVMLDDTCAEGFLPVRALGDEWFAFHEEHMRLVGESTGRSWRIGQRVAVKVDGVEIARGRIDLVLAARP